MPSAHLEFAQGSSAKFWKIRAEGCSTVTTYGKLGSAGTTTTKEHDSAEKAEKFTAKQIAAKVKKGYNHVKGGEKRKAEEEEESKAGGPQRKRARAEKAEDDGDEGTGSSLEGVVLCITGTVPGWKRAALKAAIEGQGGAVSGTVSKRVTHLVLAPGGEGTSKHTKAEAAGIKIVNESWLLAALEGDAGAGEGSDVPAQDRLWAAAASGDAKAVRQAVQDGADMEAEDAKGDTAFQLAIKNGHAACLDVLLEFDSTYASYILRCAVSAGSVACCRSAVRAGARAEAAFDEDETMMHVAGSPEMMQLAVELGVPLEPEDAWREVTTPAMLVAEDGDLDCLKFLVEQGVDLNRVNHTGQCVGSMAANEEILLYAIKHGASFIRSCDDNYSGLNNALENHWVKVLDWIFDSGFDINTFHGVGRTPVMQAAAECGIESVKYLVERGADINLQDEDEGKTPLMYAVCKSNPLEALELAKYLIGQGADTAPVTAYGGDTALALAALRGRRDVVEHLLAHGADASIKNTEGKTAAMLAEAKGHSEIAALLA